MVHAERSNEYELPAVIPISSAFGDGALTAMVTMLFSTSMESIVPSHEKTGEGDMLRASASSGVRAAGDCEVLKSMQYPGRAPSSPTSPWM